MNVRPLTEVEAVNLVAINNTGNESAFIFLTETGLRKGILDATEIVRRYFSERNFHHYFKQSQGEDAKVVKHCKIVLNSSIVSTKVSLYRPDTKNGDPRLWIYGLKEYASPDDVLALVLKDGNLYIYSQILDSSYQMLFQYYYQNHSCPIRNRYGRDSRIKIKFQYLDLGFNSKYSSIPNFLHNHYTHPINCRSSFS